MFKYILVFIFTPSAYSACLGTSFQSLHADECFQVWTQVYLGFASAQSQCAFLSYGGNLASIHNTFDNQLVSEKSTAALSQSTENMMVWLGGQDMFQLNQWGWIDNSNFTYQNWSPGNPLNATNYMCLALGVTNRYWYSIDCSTTLPYVCEFPPSA